MPIDFRTFVLGSGIAARGGMLASLRAVAGSVDRAARDLLARRVLTYVAVGGRRDGVVQEALTQ